MGKGRFRVQRKIDLDVAVSDACYGHMFGEKYLNTVKRLYETIGIKAVPLEHHGENTACCGVAGYARNLNVDDIMEVMKTKIQDIEKSGKENVLNYCMGCHTLTTMIYPIKSHYLLDKVLWALGDDMISSIYIPKAARKKAQIKFNDATRFPLQII